MFSKNGLLSEKAETAAKNAQPCVYYLTSDEQSNLRFLTIGCQGNAKPTQKEVAALLNKISADPKHKPDFILILGDNFYEFGLSSPSDSAVKTCFEDIYAAFKKLTIPCFVILGNHDENFHRHAYLCREKGVTRGLHEVAISYLADENFTSTEAKEALYSQSHLNLKSLPLWNMPHRFYSIVKNDTQIFCLDSSTLMADYIAYLKDPAISSTNQVKWLLENKALAMKANRKTIIAQHHPLFTCGKRNFESDSCFYLNEEELNFLKNHFNLNEKKIIPYHLLLESMFKECNISFDLLLAAHDHCLYYYNNIDTNDSYKICQVVSGGGGGKLQSQTSFLGQDSLGFFLREHGAVEIHKKNTDPSFNIIFHPVNYSYQLHFNTDTCLAKRHYPDTLSGNECAEIQRLCIIVKRSLETYFQFLNSKQIKYQGKYFSINPKKGNVSHGKEGIHRACQLWAYINKHEVDSYEVTMSTVYQLSQWKQNWRQTLFSKPTLHSFISLLNNEIKKEYGDKEDLNSLYQQRKEFNLQKTITVV